MLWLSLALIVVGIVVALIGFLNGGLETPMVSKSYEISEQFLGISIKGDNNDVRFALSEDGICRVECVEFEKVPNEVSVKDQTLEINSINGRKWYDYIGFSMGSGSVTVYLPSAAYQALNVDNSTGDVEVPAGFSFESVSVSSSTGDVKLSGISAGMVTVNGKTGNVEISHTTVSGSVAVRISTGKVAMKSLAAGDVTLNASTGEISLETVRCASLTTKNTTDAHRYEDVIVSGDANITGRTSDITLIGFDAANIDIKTSTGDIFGILLSAKRFDVDTSTGEIIRPQDGEGGICKARSSTGDVEFRIQ